MSMMDSKVIHDDISLQIIGSYSTFMVRGSAPQANVKCQPIDCFFWGNTDKTRPKIYHDSCKLSQVDFVESQVLPINSYQSKLG